MSRIHAYLRRHGVLFAILGVGLVIRLTVLLLYLSTHNWKGETWEPEEVARNLLEGRGFTIFIYGDIVYRSLLDPVYPVLCYVLHLIGGPGLGLYYVFQLSVASGIIWLTYAIADRWFGSQTAMVAAVLVALEPGLILYHSYKVDDIALGTFLLLLGVHVFALMTLSHDGCLACLTGLVMGVGVLTRPDLLGVFGVLPVWAILERKRLVVIFKPALLIISAAALVWAPWAIRNYLVQGQFVLLTTYSGESLWRGNNLNSTGTTVTLENQGQFNVAPVEFRNKILTASEIRKDALFKEEAFRFIAEDPAGFLWRFLKKFYFFWWFTPTYAAKYYEWVPPPLVELYRLLYGNMLAFAILGVWSVTREGVAGVRRITLFLLSVPILIAVIHSISYVEGRHRVLVMPIIMILTAYGIITLQSLRNRFVSHDSRTS